MRVDDKTEELLGLVVHSYNNFLSGAIGFTELAKLEIENAEIAEKLDLSIQSGREAVDFGNQLLCAVGRLQVSLEPIELVSVVADWATKQKFNIPADKLESPAMVNSNSTWLTRCFDIVIEFCLAYSPESEIEFKMETANGDKAVIHIRPSLIQFETEQITRLFEPFYSSRRLLGTKDVGLAVAGGFSQQMQGQLSWSNENGFRFEMPLCQK